MIDVDDSDICDLVEAGVVVEEVGHEGKVEFVDSFHHVRGGDEGPGQGVKDPGGLTRGGLDGSFSCEVAFSVQNCGWER